jgi:hypothetical protein
VDAEFQNTESKENTFKNSRNKQSRSVMRKDLGMLIDEIQNKKN